MHSLEKHPLFDCDLEAAALWYGRENPAIAARLIDEVARVVRTVVDKPLRFSVWRGEIRRVRLRRFPFLVFYEFRDNTVYLNALAHGARDLSPLLKERRSSS
jgi:plasmid stabilization system protein ParE